jgi:predicted acylesterase/phospholipase RssA
MLDAQGKSRKVAIACQGGGSHTAFTAGVIKRLLRAEELKRYEVVGLSGTSGGAVCALLAWHNLLRGDRAGAAEALEAFWRDNSATAPHEQILNSWILWASSLQNFITMPVVSPYYDNYFSVVSVDIYAEQDAVFEGLRAGDRSRRRHHDLLTLNTSSSGSGGPTRRSIPPAVRT